ncbi:helicase-related protein [Enterococcus sp. RIT-PI-f]|uniref:helicase-related protein n=1 Tax=Enterococcus sp. RIT-PI-f TaxID=1690244 RepID=UPI000ADD1B25|nr:helicase-related protein [Enterococcus sp. RIT-PI-f]
MTFMMKQIQSRINDIWLKKNGRPQLIVYKGFDENDIPDKGRRFFQKSEFYPIGTASKLFGESKAMELSRDVTTDNYYWMQYEEFVLSERVTGILFDVWILNNNLFFTQYPYRNTLIDAKKVYEDFFLKSDDVILDNEKELYNAVIEVYGDINFSKESTSYYITYQEVDIPKDRIIPLFLAEETESTINISESNPISDFTVELSDDETQFLDLTMKLLKGLPVKSIEIILTSDSNSLSNDYLNRLKILQDVIATQATFYFTNKSIKRKNVPNETMYLEILEQYWGFSTFKALEMYESIEKRNRKTIKISQAQIIDDIVQQATSAINGQDYQDIYITSSTGSGKSIMFQIPALYLQRIFPERKPLTLIISPLIGLMNDQVDSMVKKGISNAARVHSNTAPYEREKIIQGIADGKIDLLYLSPETLQARSDIKMLIGNRQLGLVIIDEAHIVTTWGKSFRADYWYLGIYLSKMRKQYKFPIVTFTATAIYGGKEDMYMDTRDSLNMERPISYFGKVKRDDIIMCIDSEGKTYERAGKDYYNAKHILALEHLQKAHKQKQKSLIYFPTIRFLKSFREYVERQAPEIFELMGIYYGPMDKEEKDEVLNSFKSGELQYVLATKAFGMGIDIPDITNVYHFAPTGNVVDYIQEVGRVARDNELVPQGYAWLDFLGNDFAEVNKLQGMGAIRKEQIIEVMRKVVSIYKAKGYNRNLIVNADDFRHIFGNIEKDDSSNLDNKIKTVMLMIEKDFSSPRKIGYSPFVARPRSLFGLDSLFVSEKFEEILLKSRLKSFFTKIGDLEKSGYKAIYEVDLAGIWEKDFKQMSFPQFKYSLFTPEECGRLKYGSIFKEFIFASGVTVPNVTNSEYSGITTQYNKILDVFEKFCREKKRLNEYFSIKELGKYLKDKLRLTDIFKGRALAQVLVNAAFDFEKIKNYKFIRDRKGKEGELAYIFNNQVDTFIDSVKQYVKIFYLDASNVLNDSESRTVYYHRNRGNTKIDEAMMALGIGQSLEVLNFEVISGYNPQIYIRINSIYQLEKAIQQGNKYRNFLLEEVYFRHKISVEMLAYLYTYKASGVKKSERIKNYTEFFWDKIEDYFMGIIPPEVEAAVYSKIE